MGGPFPSSTPGAEGHRLAESVPSPGLKDAFLSSKGDHCPDEKVGPERILN